MTSVCRRDPERRFADVDGSRVNAEGEGGGKGEDESTASLLALVLLLLLLLIVSGYEWRRMVGMGKGGGRARMD